MCRVQPPSSFEMSDNMTIDGFPSFTAFHVSRFTNDGQYA